MNSNVVAAEKVLQLHDEYKKKDEANICSRSSPDSKYKTDHAVIDTLSIEEKLNHKVWCGILPSHTFTCTRG